MAKPPPVEQFVGVMRYNRSPLEEFYNSAMEAADRRNQAMRLMIYTEIAGAPANITGIEWVDAPNNVVNYPDTEQLRLEAYVEDKRADLLAALVLLTADNALQRLGRALVDRPRLRQGFGPILKSVPLTTLLRATTNCVRHVDEWDENPNLHVGYEGSSATDRATTQALETIAVLKEALGVGRHERIHQAPSFTVLALIDGKFGTDPPDYRRFERAILSTAREIISEGNPSLLPPFDMQFERDRV